MTLKAEKYVSDDPSRKYPLICDWTSINEENEWTYLQWLQTEIPTESAQTFTAITLQYFIICNTILDLFFLWHTHKSKQQVKIDRVLVTVHSQGNEQDKGPDRRYQNQQGTEKWTQCITLMYWHWLKCSLYHLTATLMWWTYREGVVVLPFVHKAFNGVTEHEKSRHSSGDDDLQWQDGVDLAEEI